MAAERDRINWVQVLAGALAAISSAVLLSSLGVAGTVVGAAVGSIAASIGTHLYSRGLVASREQVAVRAAVLRRVDGAREEIERAATAPEQDQEVALEQADRELGRAASALESAEPDAVARRVTWRHVALVAVGLFAATMGLITAFELASGRAVSTYTGGSDQSTGGTLPGVGRKPPKERTPTPSQPPASSAPSDPPSEQPTETASPTVTPSTEPTPTTDPTETPAP